jgi:hypothetical protein
MVRPPYTPGALLHSPHSEGCQGRPPARTASARRAASPAPPLCLRAPGAPRARARPPTPPRLRARMCDFPPTAPVSAQRAALPFRAPASGRRCRATYALRPLPERSPAAPATRASSQPPPPPPLASLPTPPATRPPPPPPPFRCATARTAPSTHPPKKHGAALRARTGAPDGGGRRGRRAGPAAALRPPVRRGGCARAPSICLPLQPGTSATPVVFAGATHCARCRRWEHAAPPPPRFPIPLAPQPAPPLTSRLPTSALHTSPRTSSIRAVRNSTATASPFRRPRCAAPTPSPVTPRPARAARRARRRGRSTSRPSLSERVRAAVGFRRPSPPPPAAGPPHRSCCLRCAAFVRRPRLPPLRRCAF